MHSNGIETNNTDINVGQWAYVNIVISALTKKHISTERQQKHWLKEQTPMYQVSKVATTSKKTGVNIPASKAATASRRLNTNIGQKVYVNGTAIRSNENKAATVIGILDANL